LLRRKWRLSEQCPGIVYVGRLSREKGLSDLASVVRALAARHVAHRFIFVGDGPMRKELESGFPDAVFTGTLAPEGVAQAMASSDVFVFPSRTDTAGNVVLEAQASGLPVLVTDEGGPQENMIDGHTGATCPSTRDLCRQVLELCVRVERRRAMGAAARQYALGRQWDSALAPLYQAYRDVAASATTSAGIASRTAAA
jgi:glycosyltransferase involved in cell wall biosynthesis